MEAALQAASRPADAAFARFQLGELAWQQGRLDEADAAYQTAARLDPARSTRPPASPRCSAPGATWPAPSAPSPR